MKTINLDLHNYPAVIRYKFLELLGIKQKTVDVPKKERRLNLVEHFKDSNRAELKKRTNWLKQKVGSEGNVVYAAARSYKLMSGARPYMSLKFHSSSQFIAVVIEAVETKTEGVFNLKWGILAGDRKTKEENLRQIDGKEVVYGGKTFAVKKEEMGKGRGEHIIIECETFNTIYDQRNETWDISAWAPRMLGLTDKLIDSIDSAEKRAIADFCFQAKIIDQEGKTRYLKEDTPSAISLHFNPILEATGGDLFESGDLSKEISFDFLNIGDQKNLQEVFNQTLKKFQITVIGTKGMIEEESPTHKFNTGFFLKGPTSKLVLDYGEINPGETKLKDFGPDAVILSHGHKDHWSPELGSLSCPIWMDPVTSDQFSSERYSQLNRSIFKRGDTIKVGDFNIQTFPVLHSVKYPAVAFLVSMDDLNIGISTDIIAFHSGDREKFLSDLDFWFLDTSSLKRDLIRYDETSKEPYGHSSATTTLKWLKKTEKIPRVLLVHLGKEAVEMGNITLEETLQGIIQELNLDILVHICKDGETLTLSQVKPVLSENFARSSLKIGKYTMVDKDFNSLEVNEISFPHQGGHFRGVSVGRDKDDFFVMTHRARSRS